MSNGSVYFKATIVSETMTSPELSSRAIELGDSGSSEDFFVTLGQISVSQLSDIGSVTAPVMFLIKVVNQEAEKVRITFNGISANVISGVLGTTNPAIGIQLRDEKGNILLINESYDYPLYPGTNSLRFACSLICTGSDVVPGELSAIASFTLK